MGFQQLYQKLSPTIKRIAWRLNGHYRSFNHEDLYQEAIIRLWSDFSEGRLRDKTDSYILQGCYFHLKNYIRKVNERKNMVSLDAAYIDGEDPTIEEALGKYWSCPDCREDLDNKFLACDILDNGFSLKEKKLLQYCSQGLTTRDIGKHLNVSHVSVVKMMHKIRAKSQKYLEKF